MVIATFPTCHIGVLRELLSFRLNQRFIAMVHNPGGWRGWVEEGGGCGLQQGGLRRPRVDA